MGSSEEFPILPALGLRVSKTRGDGNCLFNALSDQIYGNQDHHLAIRTRVVEHMRENASYYKEFNAVPLGGGLRRNPKRKNAGVYSSRMACEKPSQAEIDRAFDRHLDSMAKSGTWGDNMEIKAFSSAFKINVTIYQGKGVCVIPNPVNDPSRPMAYIARHGWEHYSSVRNVNGPDSGMPHVNPKVLSPEEEQMQKQRLDEAAHVQQWQIDTLAESLPCFIDNAAIKRELRASQGDMNAAYQSLAPEYRVDESASSQPESSSVERDVESDDEVASNAPSKRRDRRMSRTSRARQQIGLRRRHRLALLTNYETASDNDSLRSPAESEAWSAPDSSQRSTFSQPPDTDDDGGVELDTESAVAAGNEVDAEAEDEAELYNNDDDDDEISVAELRRRAIKPAASEEPTSSSPCGSPPSSQPRPPIRFKLHPPRPPLSASTPASMRSSPLQAHQSGSEKMQQRQARRPHAFRERKNNIERQAQIAAHRKRQLAEERIAPAAQANTPWVERGHTNTPPAEIFRTMYL